MLLAALLTVYRQQVLKKQLTIWGYKKSITEPDRTRYQNDVEFRESLPLEERLRYQRSIDRRDARDRQRLDILEPDIPEETSGNILVEVGTNMDAENQVEHRSVSGSYGYDTEMKLSSESEDDAASMSVRRALVDMRSKLMGGLDNHNQSQLSPSSHQHGPESMSGNLKARSPPDIVDPNLEDEQYSSEYGTRSARDQSDTQSSDVTSPPLDPALFQHGQSPAEHPYFDEAMDFHEYTLLLDQFTNHNNYDLNAPYH